MIDGKKLIQNSLSALMLIVLSTVNVYAENGIHNDTIAHQVYVGLDREISSTPISDSQLSQLRGQGRTQNQPSIAVLLWDEVDNPRHRQSTNNAPTTTSTISIEIIKP